VLQNILERGKPAEIFDHESSPGKFGRAKYFYRVAGKTISQVDAGPYGLESEFLSISC
jgi:hypothetical protein